MKLEREKESFPSLFGVLVGVENMFLFVGPGIGKTCLEELDT